MATCSSILGPEKEMATHSSSLAWKIPWMEEHGGLQSMGSQRVRHDGVTSLSFFRGIYQAPTTCQILGWAPPHPVSPLKANMEAERLSHLPKVTPQQSQFAPDIPLPLPALTSQAGRKAPRRVSYLVSEGTEPQEPVLSLLQGGRELTVAELQGLGRLGDLGQVAGAQLVQVLVQVGGRGLLLDITQGLAMTDRDGICLMSQSPALTWARAHTQACTRVHRHSQQASNPQLPAGCSTCPGYLLQPPPPGSLPQPPWPECLLL